MGTFLSQKDGRNEYVIMYANKRFSHMQKKFHPMEGECYMLVWGILYFQQYLYRNHFVFKTYHKPLEWLVVVSNAYGRRGRWIDTTQDFSFKILHQVGSRHTNVDALRQNPIDVAKEDEDSKDDIQDFKLLQ